ncbi:hypothetical protein QPK87_29535 [Kamptonema cortianum]|nr:hypothetical protein [Kamptonema cortianum]
MINNIEAICFYPLVFKFVSDSCPEGVSLSAEQQTRSTKLLQEILEEKTLIALTQSSVPHYPAGQTSQRKGQPRKKKKGAFARSQKGTTASTLGNASSSVSIIENPEEAVVIPSSSEILEPVLPVREEGPNHDLSFEQISHPVPVVEGSSDETEINTSSSSSSAASSSDTSIASSSCDVGMSEDDENISFVDQWLTDIINTSQSNSKTFAIFQKATRLKLMLAENRGLLKQAQEAAAGLAVRLQMLEKRPESHKIPQRLEPFFYFFDGDAVILFKGIEI